MSELIKDYFNKLLHGIGYSLGCGIFGTMSSVLYDEIVGKDNGDTGVAIWILIWIAFTYIWIGKHEVKEKSTRW